MSCYVNWIKSRNKRIEQFSLLIANIDIVNFFQNEFFFEIKKLTKNCFFFFFENNRVFDNIIFVELETRWFVSRLIKLLMRKKSTKIEQKTIYTFTSLTTLILNLRNNLTNIIIIMKRYFWVFVSQLNCFFVLIIRTSKKWKRIWAHYNFFSRVCCQYQKTKNSKVFARNFHDKLFVTIWANNAR